MRKRGDRPNMAAEREYLRRAERARKRMTQVQRDAFDAFVLDELPYPKVAERLGLDDEEALQIIVSALVLHANEIEAEPKPRWHWRWKRGR
jgi:hypothetical protein